MADSSDPNKEDDNFIQRELTQYQELLSTSREECKDIQNNYKDLSSKMASIIKFHEDDTDESFGDELNKELTNDVEEQLTQYRSRVTAYQHTQSEQAKIVDDIHTRVEEYRRQCAEFEAVLADQSIQGDTVVDSHMPLQNVISMDLETALIRFEQEKNRCQGLSQINRLLREQLETATEVNQTLTSDIHRLTNEWKETREQLHVRESEWKEEEQSYSVYFTNENQRLLALWRQLLDFRCDFQKLKSSTEKDLSKFKVCICHTTQSVNDTCLQIINSEFPQNVDFNFNRDVTGRGQNMIALNTENELERVKLQDQIHDLLDRNEKIQQLLDEKEKVNSSLCKTIETINESLKNKMNKNSDASHSSPQSENLLSKHYQSVIKDITQLLSIDSENESLDFSPSQLADATFNTNRKILPEENTPILLSAVSAVKTSLQKYRAQVEELNLRLSSLQEQNAVQQRTIEFMDDDKQKLHQLNAQLSSQFETLHQTMQEYIKNSKETEDNFDEGKHKVCIETMVKSLKDQINSLNAEQSRLLQIQVDLQSKLDNSYQEQNHLRLSEQDMSLALNKSSRKIASLESSLDSLRKDYKLSQESFHQVSLDKEILEQEKIKFSAVLVNLEKQSHDLKTSMEKVKEEESSVKESLISLQSLCDSLSHEKEELSKSLNEATEQVKNLTSKQSSDKLSFEKEKSEMKDTNEKLKERVTEMEKEKEILTNNLQQIEDLKKELEEDKNQLSLQNNDLTNQVTKYSNQKKSLESELEKVKEELRLLLENNDKTSKENDSLARTKVELDMKLAATENELFDVDDAVAALKEEKERLESTLYASQKVASALQEEKSDLVRDLEVARSNLEHLKDQIKDLKKHHEMSTESAAREKNVFTQRIQQMEQDYQTALKNERHQHNVDVDLLSQEKESIRGNLIAAVDELLDRHQKEQEDLVTRHQEEIFFLNKRTSCLKEEFEEKIQQLKSESKKSESRHKSQINTLEQTMKNLQKQLSDSEERLKSSEANLTMSLEQQKKKLQDAIEREEELKSENNNIILNHSKTEKKLENQIEDLKNQNQLNLDNINRLKTELDHFESEKFKLVKEKEDLSLELKKVRKQEETSEDEVSLLQNQLSDQKSLIDVFTKSQEDCRNRLIDSQTEVSELKQQLEDNNQQISTLENSVKREKELNDEIKVVLREQEHSRQEARREAFNLKRKLSALEHATENQEREIAELNLLRCRDEEKEQELRKEIVLLKQKIMELNASGEAASKEMINSKKKLSDLEHKMKLQQEQHQSMLQECIHSEQSISEQRFNLEKSVVNSSQELQALRRKLNFEEGKVTALESKVLKLESGKRDVENKLISMCLSLRSILGLGSDSGVFTNSSKLTRSMEVLPTSSPSKFGDMSASLSSTRFASPLSLARMKTSTPTKSLSINVSDLDVDLLKAAVQDMAQKLILLEKERDILKDDLVASQRQRDETTEECSICASKLSLLMRELEGKKFVEQDLVAKIANCHHLEEVIRNLEREKRRMSEKNSTLEHNLSTLEKEKISLQEKVSEIKKAQQKSEEEKQMLLDTREIVESRAQKSEVHFDTLQSENMRLRETLSNRSSELKAVELSLKTAAEKLKSLESQNQAMKMTIEQLNSIIQKLTGSETNLKHKLNTLKKTLMENESSQICLSEKLEIFKKEHIGCELDKRRLQQSVDILKSNSEVYQQKNKSLVEEVEDLKNDLRASEMMRSDIEEQLQKMKSMALKAPDMDQIVKLQRQRVLLEDKVTSLRKSSNQTQELYEKKEALCRKVEAENAFLQKKIEKLEKEQVKTIDIVNKCGLERSSLERSLSKLEIENQELLRKLQNLHAELAALEERHSQRISDFLKTNELKTRMEDERLRSALKKSEEFIEIREKNHRQRVLGLEEQIKVLKTELDKERERWQKFHLKSLNANAEIGYLNRVLSNSLHNVSNDPQRLLPEAERLDLTTNVEVTTSPGIKVTTPSRLSRSTPAILSSSTPKAKRRLDLNKR